MKKYEIIENTVEIKKSSEYQKGMTFSQEGDQLPERIASFDTLEEAKDELEGYATIIEKVGNVFLVTEYYIEENTYDGEGEWVSGGDVWEVAPVLSDDDMKELIEDALKEWCENNDILMEKEWFDSEVQAMYDSAEQNERYMYRGDFKNLYYEHLDSCL